MSASPPKVTKKGREVIVAAETDLDPRMPEVEKLLFVLSEITSGFVVDCINGRLWAPGGSAWICFCSPLSARGLGNLELVLLGGENMTLSNDC